MDYVTVANETVPTINTADYVTVVDETVPTINTR